MQNGAAALAMGCWRRSHWLLLHGLLGLFLLSCGARGACTRQVACLDLLAAAAAAAAASLADASQPAGAGGAAAGVAGAASAALPADEAVDTDSVVSAAAGAASGGVGHAGDAAVKPSAVERDCRDVMCSMVRKGIDWTAKANRHVLFHLVLAVPFSVADVRAAGPGGTNSRPIGVGTALANATRDFPLAHRLGRLLDHVITSNGQRRKAADTWVWWSFETLMRLASWRACAMGVPFATRPCACVAGAAGSAAGGSQCSRCQCFWCQCCRECTARLWGRRLGPRHAVGVRVVSGG